MQTVYAAHLPLPSRKKNDQLEVAIGAVSAWVKRRFGSSLLPLSGGHLDLVGITIEWSTLTSVDAGIFSLWLDQSDETDSDWRWRTYVDVGVEGGKAWVRVRIHLYSKIEGLLTSPKVQYGRPGVVRDLVRELAIQADGRSLGSIITVERKSAAQYVDLLVDQTRQLPIVALSSDDAGDQFLDAARLADRLLGLAHIAVLNEGAAYEVTTRLGKRFSCFLGAVRIYWPRFATTDDPFRHRLFTAGALNHLGEEGLELELFMILGRLAGLSLDEPPLRRRLVLEQRRYELERSVEERAATLTRLESARSDGGAYSAQEYADLFSEYESMDARVTELESALLDAEIESELLKGERDDSRRQLSELLAEWREYRIKSSDPLPPAEEVAIPESIVEAVEMARESCKSLVLLEDAITSASESGYGDPSRVLRDLQSINEVARRWKAGELTTGPRDEFKASNPAFRDGIGQKAETRYRADYEKEYKGKPIMLGPHLARGIGAITNILRIYMYFDTKAKVIVVGHIGKKLRDDSNRN